MIISSEAILVFTDGSVLNSPTGPGGWAAVICYDSEVYEIGKSSRKSSSNEMELRAAIEALVHIKAQRFNRPIIIFSDSNYLVKGVAEKLPLWKVRGFVRNQRGGVTVDIAHKSAWIELHHLLECSQSSIKFIWVKAHSGFHGNERADMLSRQFAEKKCPDLFSGAVSRHPVGSDILALPRKTAKLV